MFYAPREISALKSARTVDVRTNSVAARGQGAPLCEFAAEDKDQAGAFRVVRRTAVKLYAFQFSPPIVRNENARSFSMNREGKFNHTRNPTGQKNERKQKETLTEH
jgi:hypothetical protein